MGDISKNFNRSEFACKCGCGFETVDTWILDACQLIRHQFGSAIITSGCRCPEHNKKVGGKPNSKHVQGCAADIRAAGGNPLEWRITVESRYPERFIDFKEYPAENFLHMEVDRH